MENPERKQEACKLQTLEFLDEKACIALYKTETEPTDIPILVAPGWGEGVDTFDASARQIAQSGREALVIDHSRERPLSIETDFASTQFKKATMLLEALESVRFEKVDGIGHSEGALNLAIAAAMVPHRFRRILISGGAGLIGSDSFPALAAPFTNSIAQGALRIISDDQGDALKLLGESTLRYIAQNTPLAFKEALEISKSDILPLLIYLQGVGIEVSVLHGAGDRAFPYERVEQNLKRNAPSINVFRSKGDHHSLFADKEEVEISLTILGKR